MIKVDRNLPASIVIGDLQIIETNEERDKSKHVSVHLSINTTIPFIGQIDDFLHYSVNYDDNRFHKSLSKSIQYCIKKINSELECLELEIAPDFLVVFYYDFDKKWNGTFAEFLKFASQK